MHHRQPLPRLWLMTDERQSEGLWKAVSKLPRESGIVFRHYGLAAPNRKALLRKLKPKAKRRRLVLIEAGATGTPLDVQGFHGKGHRRRRRKLISTASAHNLPEIRAAERAGVDLLFLSPVFATRSHPGLRPLGPLRFLLLARQARLPVIALGGMNGRRARRLGQVIYGWAGIDAWA